MRHVLFALGILTVALLSAGRAANINIETDGRERLAYVNLWGTLEEGDGDKFRALVTPHVAAGFALYRVNTFSPGGSLKAAFDIAAQIQTLRARTNAPTQYSDHSRRACAFAVSEHGGIAQRIIPSDARATPPFSCTCASACSVIWLAGLTRDGDVVGVHRFNYANHALATMPIEEARKDYVATQKIMSDYFAMAGVSATIIDRMFHTSSQDMYFLGPQEIALLHSSAFLDEITIARCGKTPAQPFRDNGAAIVGVPEDRCVQDVLVNFMRIGAQSYLRPRRN